MERRSEKRKWLARERQHQHRQRIKVNAEALEQVKEEDCTQYGNVVVKSGTCPGTELRTIPEMLCQHDRRTTAGRAGA